MMGLISNQTDLVVLCPTCQKCGPLRGGPLLSLLRLGLLLEETWQLT